jgi:hypothetical protein
MDTLLFGPFLRLLSVPLTIRLPGGNRLQSRLGIGGLDVRLPDAVLEGRYADSDVQMFSRRMPSTLWQIVVPV